MAAKALRASAGGHAKFSPAPRPEAPAAGAAVALGLHGMDGMTWIEIAVMMAAWLLLQGFVLPRLGIPT